MLSIGAADNLPTGDDDLLMSDQLIVDNGTLQVTKSMTLDPAWGIGIGPGAKIDVPTNDTLTLGAELDNAPLATSCSLTMTGSGEVELAGAEASVIGMQVNINAGTLYATQSNSLGQAPNVTLAAGATFQLGGDTTVGALNGAGHGRHGRFLVDRRQRNQ